MDVKVSGTALSRITSNGLTLGGGGSTTLAASAVSATQIGGIVTLIAATDNAQV